MFDHQKLDRLFNQPLSRRDFLRNIGITLLAVTSIGPVLNLLSTGHDTPISAPKKSLITHGFGDGRFGG